MPGRPVLDRDMVIVAERPTVGAPFFVTRYDVLKLAGEENQAIESFDVDLRAKLAYFDQGTPANTLRGVADEDDYKYLTSPKLGFAAGTDAYNVGRITLFQQFVNLPIDAPTVSAKNAAGKSAAVVTQEKNFYAQWEIFRAKWYLFYKRIQEFNLFGYSPQAAWEKLNSFDTQFKAYKATALSTYGVTQTMPDPPTTAKWITTERVLYTDASNTDTGTQAPETKPDVLMPIALIAGGVILAASWYSSTQK